MKPIYTYTLALATAGILFFGKALPAVTHVNGGATCPAEQCWTLPAKDSAHTHVESLVAGFRYYQDGPLSILRPA